ncbi:MAG: signal peptidase II [Lachnospiraceae bacterium]|nr:signal peptidase II [Ruminococcus sp.]MCM1274694.1 signal peptidase II [Lachnospiraceae bacterium]
MLQYIWLLIAALLVGLDRLTKYTVSANMELGDTIHIIKFGDTEVLNVYYCLNNGAAFSQLKGHKWFLIAITSVVIVGLLYLMLSKRVKRPVYVAAIGLILGGGVGNLIDRLFNDGLVVDFIDFRLINFPIFNVADICAVCGTVLLFIVAAVDEIKSHKKKKAGAEAKDNENGND